MDLIQCRLLNGFQTWLHETAHDLYLPLGLCGAVQRLLHSCNQSRTQQACEDVAPEAAGGSVYLKQQRSGGLNITPNTWILGNLREVFPANNLDCLLKATRH